MEEHGLYSHCLQSCLSLKKRKCCRANRELCRDAAGPQLLEARGPQISMAPMSGDNVNSLWKVTVLLPCPPQLPPTPDCLVNSSKGENEYQLTCGGLAPCVLSSTNHIFLFLGEALEES